MILDDIVKKRKERYKEIKKSLPLEELKEKIEYPNKPSYVFYDLFKNNNFVYIPQEETKRSICVMKNKFLPLNISKGPVYALQGPEVARQNVWWNGSVI